MTTAGIPVLANLAGAAPDPIAEAQQRVDDARREANEAASRYTDAQSSYEDLGNKIAAVEERIAAGEARRDQLRGIAERRAVIAYKNLDTDRTAILDSATPRDGLRSSELLDRANEADNDVVAHLAALNAELAIERDQLSTQQKDQREWRSRLEEERKLLEAKVDAAVTALRDLQVKALSDAAREARRASGLLVDAPVIDGLVCPVPGAAFSSDFGAPRAGHTHQGNDMFAPIGTPNLAVVSGNVTYGPGGSGGMGAYLDGGNGVTYVYYHLSEYVGGPRHVEQGEIIAKLGMTGNAGAPHTHFEIRPGGRTSPAINPFPTLSKIC